MTHRVDSHFLSPSVLLKRYGLHAKKSWGQCFLHDPFVVHRILESCSLQPSDTVVEIGAGLGVLTRPLSARAQNVVAIEKDRDLVPILRHECADVPNLTLIEANALTFDFRSLGTELIVVGNLPYHISSPLLFRLLEYRDVIRTAVVMLQKEVAQRIAAPPGSKTYGAPSAMLQFFSTVDFLFSVGKGAFIPAPQVDSAMIKLSFHRTLPISVDMSRFQKLVRTAFSARRKTLLRSLSTLIPKEQLLALFQRFEIDPALRPEMLSAHDFARLTHGWQEQQSEVYSPR